MTTEEEKRDAALALLARTRQELIKALYSFMRANAQAKRDLYRALQPEGWEPGCDLTPSRDGD